MSTPGGLIGGVSLWALYSYLLIAKAYPHLKDTLNDDDSDVNASMLVGALVVFGGAVPFVTGAALGRLFESCLIKGAKITQEKCANSRQNTSFFTAPVSETTNGPCEVLEDDSYSIV